MVYFCGACSNDRICFFWGGAKRILLSEASIGDVLPIEIRVKIKRQRKLNIPLSIKMLMEINMWERPEPHNKTDLAVFVINQLVEKINQEKLLVDPKDILDIAIIALSGSDVELPVL